MDQSGKVMGWDPTWETEGRENLGWGGGRVAEVRWPVTSWPWSKAGSGVVPIWQVRWQAGGDAHSIALPHICMWGDPVWTAPLLQTKLSGKVQAEEPQNHSRLEGRLQMPCPYSPLAFHINNISPLQRQHYINHFSGASSLNTWTKLPPRSHLGLNQACPARFSSSPISWRPLS